MYEFRCLHCGNLVRLEGAARTRKFCSKQCHGAYYRDKKMVGVAYTRPANRDICPAGYDNLVVAICNMAAADFMENAAGTWMHDDAVQFFRSDWFANLTDMDGDEILARLTEKKERKKQRGKRK